jgi:hypothetical protein
VNLGSNPSLVARNMEVESLAYELWNEGGEDAVKNFGVVLSRHGLEVIRRTYNGNRFKKNKDGMDVVMTPFGDVILVRYLDLQ